MMRLTKFIFGISAISLLMAIAVGSAVAQRTSTQTVSAQQSGPWSVGIDPASNGVKVGNTDAEAVPVKIVTTGPGKKPFQSRVVVNIPAGSGVAHVTMMIPNGKRMVIENVSAIARTLQGTYPFIQFLTNFDDGDGVFGASDIAYHRIALSDQGNFNGTIYSTANHKTLVFSDSSIGNHGNLGVTVSFGTSTIVAQTTTAEVTLSGYLEDAPTQQ